MYANSIKNKFEDLEKNLGFLDIILAKVKRYKALCAT